MLSTLSQETIHVDVLDALDIARVNKPVTGQLSQQFGCDTAIVNRAIAGRAWNAA